MILLAPGFEIRAVSRFCVQGQITGHIDSGKQREKNLVRKDTIPGSNNLLEDILPRGRS